MDKLNAKFLFEIGMLQNIPRSGLFFLGTGRQSVAEHTHRAMAIAFLLSTNSSEKVDQLQLLKMILFHDFLEARISDLNWVNHKYVQPNIEKALHSIVQDYPFATEIAELIDEFENQKTIESQIANDADQIEFIITLKTQHDLGNKNAIDWVPAIKQRLHTELGKKLVDEILSTKYDEWWFSNKKDAYWINRE